MSHLPFTITAYFFNALAVTANKFLLNKTIPEPLVYVFYISLVSVLAILALPFTRVPTLDIFFIASTSTIFWTTGAYFMFKALKTGAVSRVIPIIGTLIPLILLAAAYSTNTVSQTQMIAIVILLIGMFFLTRSDWKGKLDKKEIIFEILSAVTFAISYITLKQAYLKLDFFSVLIWSRLILLPLCLFLLFVSNIRKQIITSKGSTINFFSKSGLLFIGGQAAGITSEILLLFSISLANPALVNSLRGTQYIFLLIFSLVLFREKYTSASLISKITGIAAIGIGLYLLAFS